MYRADAPVNTVSIAASNPLLRAGLQRAAETAGLAIVPDAEGPAMALRSGGAGSPHRALDLSVEDDRVVITVSRPPAAETWQAVRDLVEQVIQEPATLGRTKD